MQFEITLSPAIFENNAVGEPLFRSHSQTYVQLIEARKYGDTVISFLERTG